MVEQVIKMADEARKECAEATDGGPEETKPYDRMYYGELSSIPEYKKHQTKTTTRVLKNAGGKFATLRQDDNHFWKPKSRIFTKEFVKRFPMLSGT